MNERNDSLALIVIESNRDLSILLKEDLALEGHQADIANHEGDAIYLLSNKKYDCILLDVMLEKKSKFQLIESLRKKSDCVNFYTPVLLLGADISKIIIQSLKGKIHGILNRPFTTDDLLERINDILIKQKVRASLLVIDDNEELLKIMSKTLKAHKFFVSSASTVGEAYDLILERKFDCIIMDAVMESEFNRNFLKETKNNKKSLNKNTSIVLMSGHDPQKFAKEIPFKVDGFIEKPFDDNALVTKIKTVLQKRLQKK